MLTVNHGQPARMVEMVEQALGALRGKRAAVLGLAFKPGTDDVRESPAFPIIAELTGRGATVRAFDPVARELPAVRSCAARSGVAVVASLDEALEAADAAILVTRWEDFRALPDLLTRSSPRPLLVDGRRMLDRTSYAPYAGVGLGPPV